MRSTRAITANTIMTSTASTIMATSRTDPPSPATARFGRRALLTGGVAGVSLGAGAALGLTGSKLAGLNTGARDAAAEGTVASAGADGDLPGFGGESLPCHGRHQAGIVSPPATHIRFAAYELRPSVDREAIERLFRVLTDDIEGLTSGSSP